MNVIHTSGKRKRAVARATLKPGKGHVKVNNVPIEHIAPNLVMMKIKEPLILAGPVAAKVDISVNVFGGGFMSRAEASRLAIARALAQFSPKLEEVFVNYERQLLVADVRRKESSKPNSKGQARSKRQKSYR